MDCLDKRDPAFQQGFLIYIGPGAVLHNPKKSLSSSAKNPHAIVDHLPFHFIQLFWGDGRYGIDPK